MKKTYMNPEMEVFKLAIAQPLLDSSVNALNGEADKGTKGMGRSFDFDDED